MQNNTFFPKKILNVRGTVMDLSTPKVMGVLNVTPDSFFDGGKHTRERDILQQTARMLQEGADFIDVGGASTRPGAPLISLDEELNRVMPAIRCIRKIFPTAYLSIDTFRSAVAQQALDEGVVLVNDISGGQLDKDMFSLIARYQVPYVLTHMRGLPKTMQTLTSYEDLWEEMINYFQEKINQLHQIDVKDILIDPGFGFAKTTQQNFDILKQFTDLHLFSKPLLVGVSRKSMIWKTLKTTPEEALNGSTILHTLLLLRGAHVLRVHDVKEAVEAIKLLSFAA